MERFRISISMDGHKFTDLNGSYIHGVNVGLDVNWITGSWGKTSDNAALFNVDAKNGQMVTQIK